MKRLQYLLVISIILFLSASVSAPGPAILIGGGSALAGSSSAGSSGSSSGGSAPADPPETIDGPCKLCFYANTKETGHGFLKIKTPDGSWRGYGYYPAGESIASPLCDSGTVQDDGTAPWNQKICYDITAVQCKKVFDIVEKWKTQNYYLLSVNCVDFLGDVAGQLDIDIPGTGVGVSRPAAFGDNINAAGGIENTAGDKTKDTDPDTGGEMIRENELKEREEFGEEIPENPAVLKESLCSTAPYVELANENIHVIPDNFRGQLRDQRVNVIINTPDGGPQEFAVLFEGETVIDITPPILDPTTTLETDLDTIEYIVGDGEGAVGRLTGSLLNGDITLTRHTEEQETENVIGNIAQTFTGLFNPSQQTIYDIRVGQQQPIVYQETPAILIRPQPEIRIVIPQNQPDSLLINRRGTIRGFTPTRGTFLLSPRSTTYRTPTITVQPYSASAGLYTQPRNEIRGWAIPYAQQATQARNAVQARQAQQAQQYSPFRSLQYGGTLGTAFANSGTAYTVGGFR
jgi:hypothetical protein